MIEAEGLIARIKAAAPDIEKMARIIFEAYSKADDQREEDLNRLHEALDSAMMMLPTEQRAELAILVARMVMVAP